MNLKDLNNLNIDLAQLREIDFNTLANSPWPVKLLLSALLAGTVAGAGWWLDWREQALTLERAVAQEQDLRRSFEIRQRRAANLDAYREQLEQMQAAFGAMLRQLPSQAEIAALLVDISQTGLAAGLEFELFQPQSEVRREFYAELPVKIRVRGDYHQFGRFVSGVAALPRIVTLHDVDLRPAGSRMTMELTAKTYWYLDEGRGR